MFDIHHHNCVNNGEKIDDLLPQIFHTWDGEAFNPKIHFSSPKSPKDFRSHADDIDINDFGKFLDIARKVGRDFDVMLEAKNKDVALHIKNYDTFYLSGGYDDSMDVQI